MRNFAYVLEENVARCNQRIALAEQSGFHVMVERGPQRVRTGVYIYKTNTIIVSRNNDQHDNLFCAKKLNYAFWSLEKLLKLPAL